MKFVEANFLCLKACPVAESNISLWLNMFPQKFGNERNHLYDACVAQ